MCSALWAYHPSPRLGVPSPSASKATLRGNGNGALQDRSGNDPLVHEKGLCSTASSSFTSSDCSHGASYCYRSLRDPKCQGRTRGCVAKNRLFFPLRRHNDVFFVQSVS